METLSASGNQIKGINTYDANEEIAAGALSDSSGGTDGVAQAGSNTGWNGNWIKFRNFVNKLRTDVDAWAASIVDASPVAAGKVTTGAQAFGGEKQFEDGLSTGKAGQKEGFLKIFNTVNSLYVSLKASVTGTNKTLFLPDRNNETLATTADLASKQDALAANTNVQIARIDATTVRIRNASGNYIDVTVPASAFQNGALVIPAKSGTVMVKPAAFLAPFNVRVHAIQATNYLDPTVKVGRAVADGLYVVLKWCLDGMSGTGDGVDKFTFDSVPAFDLTGYYIYFPQYSRNLKIASMNGAVATLTSEEGLSTAIGAANTGDLPYVHCNANWYEIVAIPYNPDTEELDPFNAVIVSQTYKVNGITQPYGMVNLPIGTRFHFMVASVIGDERSAYGSVPLTGGAYTLVKMPNITADGSVTVAPTRAGLRVNIAGWADATAYELCLSASGDADFDNVNHQKIIATSKEIDIALSDSRSYSVKVRPLLRSQVVGTEIHQKAVSGAGGALPSDQCLISIPVHIRTYSGSFTYNGTTGAATLSSVKTPSGGTTDVAKLDEKLVGSVLKDAASHEFLIAECLDTNVFTLKNIGTNNFTPQTGTFEINTTKRGRMAFYGELNKIDYDITLVSFDCDLQVRHNSVLRWYQEANENAYDSLVVNLSDKEFKKDTDLKVYSSNDVSNGKRVFVIDFFDASGSPENRGGVTGTVSVYGRPRSITNAASVN